MTAEDSDLTSDLTRQPTAQDLVLGGQLTSEPLLGPEPLLGSEQLPGSGSLILGGLAGIQAQLLRSLAADRIAALRTLTQRSPKEAIPLMIAALLDQSLAVQKIAYLYLTHHIGDPIVDAALSAYSPFCLFELLGTLIGHTQGITAVTTGTRQYLHRDSQLIVISADRSGYVKVWDAIDQVELLELPTWKFAYGLYYDCDRDYIWLRTAQDNLSVWSLKTGQEVDWTEDQTLEAPDELPLIRLIASVVRLEDRYLIGGNQRQIKIWDLQHGREIAVLSGHRGLVNAVAMGDDRGLLVSGSEDKTVCLWGIG
jgi:hypothetical protein